MFIQSLEHLQVLSLSDSQFSGRIPNILGNLTKLKFLDLSFNTHLYASDSDWIFHLSSLEYLDMSYVYLGKAQNLLQVLNTLPSLSIIEMENCNLNELHPQNLVRATTISKLQVLNLVGNGLEAQILDAFHNLTSITFIDLSLNNLNSTPLWLSSCNKLVSLFLANNVFSGSFPSVLQNLTSLIYLGLSENSFDYVPSWLGRIKGIQYLNLSGNNISVIDGSVTSILGNCCRLHALDMSRNNVQRDALGDYIQPGCVRHALMELDLSNNEFNDSLPEWLGQVENLCDLRVYDSNLVGTLSCDMMTKLVNLEVLELSNNNLIGSLPDCFGQLIKLKALFLSSNHFLGVIPKSLEKLVSLKYIDLSRNSLSGTIPQSIDQLQKLNTFYLSNNNLHGKIPNSFSQLLNLHNLDMSLNHLESLVSEIRWPKQLVHLNLTNNNFTGSLLQDIADRLPNVTHLLLGNNRISGPISNSLCKIDSLYNLDLSGNMLSGKISNCWSVTQRLNEVNFACNKLSGVIPSSLDNLPLAWLHLNNNSLYGRFPLSLANLKHLLILDLGENHLSGIIPSWIGNIFSSMQILRLRQNKLNGAIPLQLCKLSALQILDLSNSNLMGSIPHCIGNLTGMISGKKSFVTQPSEGLDILKGPIPRGNQLSSLDDPFIYAGNPFLCGHPRPNECFANDSQHGEVEDEDGKEHKPEKLWFRFGLVLLISVCTSDLGL
ncbi:hypothetical protein VNO78_21771 [Psophocarpus tetragonolobus]|uniref:Uncharacterized protein n=1 Tax=Psophocarpus tetragonolobus TaxID=3891 RepID=A0AAN9SC57_PSOTE